MFFKDWELFVDNKVLGNFYYDRVFLKIGLWNGEYLDVY